MYSKLDSLHCQGNLSLVVGLMYLLGLIVTCFVGDGINEPVPLLLSNIIVFQGRISNGDVELSCTRSLMIVFKLLGFVIAVFFLL